jgi:hypothetical protein
MTTNGGTHRFGVTSKAARVIDDERSLNQLTGFRTLGTEMYLHGG